MGAWGRVVQATLLFLQCRWPGWGRAEAGPAAARSYRGCSRVRKTGWFSAGCLHSSVFCKNYHKVSVIRSFFAAAQGAWTANREGQGVPGKDFLGVKPQA